MKSRLNGYQNLVLLTSHQTIRYPDCPVGYSITVVIPKPSLMRSTKELFETISSELHKLFVGQDELVLSTLSGVIFRWPCAYREFARHGQDTLRAGTRKNTWM